MISPLRGEEGTVIGYAKVTRDLTERRAAQQRAISDARRVGEAEAASRMKSEFLTVMSHELRTPINATIGYAQLIDAGIGGSVTDQQRDYITRICSSQQHLLRIINDLLDYGRISAKKITLDFSPVSMQAVVDAVLPMVEPQAAARGLQWHCVRGDSDAVVRADRIKAEQILLNLLSNAVKFTLAGGRITVTTAVAGAWVTVAVQDTRAGHSAGQGGGDLRALRAARPLAGERPSGHRVGPCDQPGPGPRNGRRYRGGNDARSQRHVHDQAATHREPVTPARVHVGATARGGPIDCGGCPG